MKKNIGKKFHLMAMLASLTLVCWGGVTACSNGSDSGDDGGDGDKATEVTKTISFNNDEGKEILETSDISEDMASIKITVTGITGTTSDDWWFWANTDGSNGDKIEWKSGEGEACIYEVTITDANKIKYIKENGLAIKGATGLTAKVTVKITKSESTGDEDKTGDTGNTGGATTGGDTTGGTTSGGDETGTDSGNSGNTESTGNTGSETGNSGTGETTTQPSDDDDKDTEELKEFSYSYEASKISENTASITITITNVTGTTSGDWWFWANTDGGDGDKIAWKSGGGAESIYEVTITDAAKIAYIKENGLKITGAKGLTADATVTQSDKINNEENDKETEEPTEFSFSYETSKISENTASITITVTNVTGTTSGDWWFWANTDGGDGDKIAWKSGGGAESIYEVTITDAAKIAYIKENGLKITGAAGLDATVTVNCKV